MSEHQKKIVYLDDTSFHLFSTKERLKNHFEVYPAQTVEILKEILKNITPDLILLDINMPLVSGFDVIKMLKDDTRYANIPVIFLTAKDDKHTIETAMALGAADFVMKPYNDSKLIECIQNQVNPEMIERNKPVILAVDDSPSILQEVNHVLKDLYNVRTLADPEELGEVLKYLTPDLFLMDYKMPKVTGVELLSAIRKYRDHRDTPILFLSSEGTTDNISLAINAGVSDFIVKPIDYEILRKKIAVHLKDYMKRRRIRQHSKGE